MMIYSGTCIAIMTTIAFSHTIQCHQGALSKGCEMCSLGEKGKGDESKVTISETTVLLQPPALSLQHLKVLIVHCCQRPAHYCQGKELPEYNFWMKIHSLVLSNR